MMADPIDKLTIDTPELIPLEYRLAGIGSRFLAAAVDTLIQVVISLAFVVAGMLVMAEFPLANRGGVWVAAIGIFLYFLLQFAYFAGMEAWWNGQTLGKRQLHIRVIKESGRPITPYDAVARNLLRIVDSLPGFYGIGILSMLLSSKNKRLGDFVAGTVVIHEQPLVRDTHRAWASQAEALSPACDIAQLAPEAYQLMEAFLVRREQLEPDIRRTMARQVILRIKDKLKIPDQDLQNPEVLIEKLVKEYRNRSQFR